MPDVIVTPDVKDGSPQNQIRYRSSTFDIEPNGVLVVWLAPGKAQYKIRKVAAYPKGTWLHVKLEER